MINKVLTTVFGSQHERDVKKMLPVVAAINGAAVGVGITMTLAMDIRLAARNVKMGFVFAARGINDTNGQFARRPPGSELLHRHALIEAGRQAGVRVVLILAAAIAKNSANDATLRLEAADDIFINQNVTAAGGGKLNLEFIADADASGAGFAQTSGTRSLTTGGGHFTLPSDLVITGGNIDTRLLASVLTRELVRESRIVSLRIIGDDRPGLLANVSAIIGQMGANIIEVSHNRLALDVPAKGAEFDLMIETRDAQHTQEVMDALRERGYPPRVV